MALNVPTLMLTRPVAVGVTLNVYVVPEPLKRLTVPLLTATSDALKPVTGSLNLAMTGIGDVCVGLAEEELSVTEGDTVSKMRINVAAGVFPFPAASIALNVPTSTCTAPCAVGVTLKVYV